MLEGLNWSEFLSSCFSASWTVLYSAYQVRVHY